MGSSSSSIDNIPNAQEIMQETGFSAAHLLRLYERFQFLDRDQTGKLRPEDFGALRELAMNPIGDRIIGAFFSPGQETVDFPSFVRILAHFRPTDSNRTREGPQQEPANSRTRKLKFAFQLYDQDRDGKISRAELLQVLRAMLGLQVTEEQLQSIAERAIQEADLDKDDAISFDEFRKSLEKVNIEHKMSIRFLR
ncbi:calcineurin B homologous protein 2 [Trachinotus anak]|uniref:calcineurin B homologous protein 2 n=1 Tax=Trachinotus anak TaxID=443729 RepID=UPI0039F1C4F0